MSYGQAKVVSIVDSTEPVTLAEAKNYLRVTTTQDDTKITSQITAARAIAETYLNRDILPKERKQFILLEDTSDRIVELYGGEIDTTEGVTITIDGVATTEGNEWKLVGLNSNQHIQFSDSENENIEITYQTIGLTNDASVKQGVLAILAELYEYGEVSNKWIWAILKPLRKPYF